MSEDIKAGTYKGRAIAGSERFGVSSNGTEQCSFSIDVPELGRSLSTVLSFSEAATPFALERLRACGWQDGDGTLFKNIAKNEINVIVKYEEWQGQQKMKVEILTGNGGITFQNPMSQQQVSRLGAYLNGKAKAAPSTNGSARPAQAKKQEVADDEFPT